MLHHEMWRDELQAWLLARDTVSLRDLFHQLRYEGHPALWYLVLRPITALSRDPRWMQWLSVVLGASSAYVFARFAPFTRAIRVLFAFGYFVVYGYTIVARSYGLQMLLLLILCAVIAGRRSRILVALLLILIANTSVYGGIIVLALVGAFVMEAVWEGRKSHSVRRRLRDASVVVLSGLVGVALLAAQVRRPADAPFDGNGLGAATLHGAPVQVRHQAPAQRLTPVWRAYVPIPATGSLSDLWNSDFVLGRSQRAERAALLASAVMLAMAIVILRKSTLALVFFVLATGGILLFSLLIYVGSLYHHGHFVLVLVMALWLAASERRAAELAERSSATGSDPSPAARREIRGETHRAKRHRLLAALDEHSQLLIGLFLLVQVVGAAFRLVADYRFPFSEGKAAAEYIRSHGLRDSVLAVDPAFQGATVSGYLDRPLCEVGTGVRATYTPLRAGPSQLSNPEILSALKARCMEPGRSAILITNRPLDTSDPALSITPLQRLPQTIIASEGFYVYDVRSLH